MSVIIKLSFSQKVKIVSPPTKHMRLNPLQKVILVLALLGVFLLIYSPHFSYHYPLHVDEYQHLARAKAWLEGKSLGAHPYLPEEPKVGNFEPGFTIFLAIIFYIFKQNTIFVYQFLPAIFAVISAFILFHLMHLLTKKFSVSIFTLLFFASMRSNTNIGGLWFFTPFTLAIPFIFLFLFLMAKHLQDGKKLFFILGLITLSILALIHPLSAVFVAIIIFIFFLISKEWKSAFFLILFMLALFGISLLLFKQTTTANLLAMLQDWLILEKGWGYLEISYTLPQIYGLVPFSLAVLGLYPAIKEKPLRFWVVWFVLTSGFIFLFQNFGFSVLFPYQRILYYSLISLAPLSALGLSFLIDRIKHINGKKHKKNILIALLIILVFIAAFWNYYDSTPETGLYHVLEDQDYKALQYLAQFPQATIIVPLPQSSAVSIITSHKLIGLTKGNLLGGNQEKVQKFYQGSCKEKKEILNQYNITYVLSREKINCSYLEEIYNNQEYIYRVNISSAVEQS